VRFNPLFELVKNGTESQVILEVLKPIFDSQRRPLRFRLIGCKTAIAHWTWLEFPSTAIVVVLHIQCEAHSSQLSVNALLDL
jgi:hypothetical protein